MEVKVISNVNSVALEEHLEPSRDIKKYGTIHELFSESKYHRCRCGLLNRDVTENIWGNFRSLWQRKYEQSGFNVECAPLKGKKGFIAARLALFDAIVNKSISIKEIKNCNSALRVVGIGKRE